ncbi:hypothetical protein CARUB_v10015483mg [Capsella rubella]|uniref:Uncharacterized protein n=1 Tax=Capsella rubella TaxID=81985 RepID=R0HR10_9BRAS|nr:hypothetical protein CARUB_v10015483mg [Capsella rubella]
MKKIVFPEDQLLQRLFTPSLAQKYEELYRQNGVKFVKFSWLVKLFVSIVAGDSAAVQRPNTHFTYILTT